MKKLFFTIVFLIFSINTFSQDSIIKRSEINLEISRLKLEILSIEKSNHIFQQNNSNQKKQFDSVTAIIAVIQSNMQRIADSLHITISDVSITNEQNQTQFQSIVKTISNRTFYWLIGILLVALLSIFTFLFLRRKLTSSSNHFDKLIAKTNLTLETEAIKLDSKLVEILQSQLSILKEERKAKENANEVDHKLPVKVGEEIHRMRKRIENMPKDIKGLSALTNSLQRLEEEFNDSGYEIEDLLGRKYVDGMKVEARFVDNPEIPKGEEIITDVLRPQILYKGIVVQFAKVEVGKSY